VGWVCFETIGLSDFAVGGVIHREDRSHSWFCLIDFVLLMLQL